MRPAAVMSFAVLLFAATLAADTPPPRSSFEQVLLPVALFQYVPGALGTLWNTDFVGFNAAAGPVAAFQSECAYYCTCNDNPCAPGIAIPASHQFFVVPMHDLNGHNQGIFLYFAKPGASSIAYSLRIHEFTRGTTPTELPVVHERDFRNGTTILPGVPIDAFSRTRLRIYGISSPDGSGALRVRIVPADGSATTEMVVSLTPPNSGSRIALPDELPEQPSYADAGDLNHLVSGSTNVRIEIEANTPGLLYWPFVTVTNNDTQHLLTVTPQ